MITTRREFNKLALTALPAMGLTASSFAKPNSKFGGVQIGIIAPYSFRGLPSSADDLLKYLVQLGINVVEMQSEPVEAYAGAPAQGRGTGRPSAGRPGPAARRRRLASRRRRPSAGFARTASRQAGARRRIAQVAFVRADGKIQSAGEAIQRRRRDDSYRQIRLEHQHARRRD